MRQLFAIHWIPCCRSCQIEKKGPLILEQEKVDFTRKLQLEILDLLVEFDRICREANIRYFVSCGTLLGAIRHHGFIPWDNDADVEMLREDYEKFSEVCPKLIQNDKFFFQDSTTDSNYNWPYGKLRKKGTRYVRPGQGGLKQKDGICIDIFVLDDMAPSYPIQCLQYQLTCLCRKILWASVGAKLVDSVLGRFVFGILQHVPRNFALGWYHDVVGWYRGKDTGWLGFFNTGRSSARSYAYLSEWYRESLDCEFEGYHFSIPNGYDEILRVKYQNYMELPPEEKRKGTSGACYILFSDGVEFGELLESN